MDDFQESRLEMHLRLSAILDHVYFQPPENVKIEYPCIIYKLDTVRLDHADDDVYKKHHRYQITLIDRAPDSEYFDPILELPYSSFERYYVSDNLNHFVFTSHC